MRGKRVKELRRLALEAGLRIGVKAVDKMAFRRLKKEMHRGKR